MSPVFAHGQLRLYLLALLNEGPRHGYEVIQDLDLENASHRTTGAPKLLVEINDEMIAAERRYIAAASVAEITDSTAELALPAAPRT